MLFRSNGSGCVWSKFDFSIVWCTIVIFPCLSSWFEPNPFVVSILFLLGHVLPNLIRNPCIGLVTIFVAVGSVVVVALSISISIFVSFVLVGSGIICIPWGPVAVLVATLIHHVMFVQQPLEAGFLVITGHQKSIINMAERFVMNLGE